jgi:ribosome-binding protein aMBF1 (putative translation factor)
MTSKRTDTQPKPVGEAQVEQGLEALKRARALTERMRVRRGGRRLPDSAELIRAEREAREALKKDLWVQLVEARQAAGLTQAELAERLGTTQAQIARIEKHGYSYTLRSLRRYVQALGGEFSLEVRVRHAAPDDPRAHHVVR